MTSKQPLARSLLCLAALTMAAPGEARCRLALALGMDISSSVSPTEYAIQLHGLAAAFRDPQVIEAVLSVPGEVVYVLPYEWSGRQQQDAIGGWTALRDAGDIAAFAERMDAHVRRYENFSTAIGTSIDFALTAFTRLPEPCERMVIDLSGDGVNNDGPAADTRWPDLDRAGVTLNALAIAGGDPDPVPHYLTGVIRGPGAFLIVAEGGFDDYPELIKGKLIRELGPPMLIGHLAR